MSATEVIATICAAGGATILGWFAADAVLWVRRQWASRPGAGRA